MSMYVVLHLLVILPSKYPFSLSVLANAVFQLPVLFLASSVPAALSTRAFDPSNNRASHSPHSLHPGARDICFRHPATPQSRGGSWRWSPLPADSYSPGRCTAGRQIKRAAPPHVHRERRPLSGRERATDHPATHAQNNHKIETETARGTARAAGDGQLRLRLEGG